MKLINLKFGVVVAFTAMLCLHGTFAHAQLTLAQYTAQYDSLKPFVNSGILLDRSPHALWAANADYNPYYFKPNLDSACSSRIFRDLYSLFYHSDYQNELFKFNPDSFEYRYNLAYYGLDPSGYNTQQLLGLDPQADVVLGLMGFRYNMISATAWDSNMIWLDNSMNKYRLLTGDIHISDTIVLDTTYYHDVLGQWVTIDTTIVIDSTWYRGSPSSSNAFDELELLTISNLSGIVCIGSLQESVRFIVPPAFLFFQFPDNLNFSFLIDFDDGQGFRTVIPGQVININYTSFGIKTIYLMLTDSMGNPLHDLSAKTFVYIEHCKLGTSPDAIIDPTGFNPCGVPDGGFGTGNLVGYVKYGNHGLGKLTRPFILVEGFETGRYKVGQPEFDQGDRWGFGDLNWRSFSSGNFGEVAPQLAMFPNFADTLIQMGYDVIIVDIHSNRAKIQKNANALINLIQLVNDSLRINESYNQLTVLGASMGGLIVRYALRKMELSSCCHNTQTYITFSSPHKGANIPYSIQQLIYEMGHELNLFKKGDIAKERYDHVLNSPAARQILVYHIGSGASSDRTQFQNELDSIGQPINCRRLALTNGSDVGIGQKLDNENLQSADFVPGAPFIDLVLKMYTPITVPGIILPILGLGDAYATYSGNPNSNGIITLVKAKAYVTPYSPGQPAGSWALERGKRGSENWNDYIEQWGIYTTGMYVLFVSDLAHNIAKVINLSSMLCSFCPAIQVSDVAVKAAISAAFTTALIINKNDNYDGNFINNSSTSTPYSFPTLPYDNAPGDYNTTIQDLHEQGGKISTLYYPHHNFISTVSALDIVTNNLFMHVEDEVRNNQAIIPFEDYWANGSEGEPSKNQRHVEITQENINWMVRKLNETHPKFLSQQSGPELDEYYNFGTPVSSDPDSIILAPDVFLPTVAIKAGGNLHVNKYDSIAYQNSNLGSPTEYSGFILNTAWSACDSPHIIIEADGEFYIGDNNYVNLGGGLQDNNKADVFFRAGSKLELLGDALLHINDNSRLVIEEGAELILHKEHSIHLDGKNAVLEIRGKLTLKSSALLKPTGDGYLRFAQPVNQAVASDFWEFESGAVIELNGSGKEDKKAEITGKLALDSALSFFKVLNCRVDIHPGMEMHIKGRATIENARITKPQGAISRYGSVVVYGQPNLIVKNAEFLHGNYGLLALLPSAAHPLKVENSDFKHCITGLRINGKNLELKTSRLDSNTVGLKIDAATASCDIRNSQFNRNSSMGIEFSGQSTAALYFHESQSKYNGTGIQASGNCPVRLTCSSISNNTIGLDAYTVEVLLGGEARNDFTANQIGISISDVKHLILHDGYNNFATSTTYLYGAFADNPNLIYDGTNYKLNVQNNRLPAEHGLVAVDLLTYSAAPVLLHNWQPLSAFATLCPLAALASLDSMMLGNAITTLPVETSYQNGKLPLVIATAISDMTDDLAGVANRDEEAVAKFGEIFSFVRNHYTYRSDVQYLDYELSEDEVKLMRFVINKALKALGNAYRYELLEPNRAVNETEVSEQLQTVQDELDNQLYYYNQDYDEERWFYNKLAKAQAYRSGEHYDYALEQLAGISTEDGKLEGIRDYWSCICEAEADFILEITDATQYMEALDECVLNAPELRRRSPGPGIAVELLGQHLSQINYTLYPNPNNGLLTVSSNVTLSGMSYRVTDMQGTIHLSGGISTENSKTTLDASMLSNGVYFLQIINNSTPPQTLKFVITR